MDISYLENKTVNYKKIKKLLKKSFKQNHYTNNGPVKEKLENHLDELLEANTQGKKTACFSSGTSALHALMFLHEDKQQKKMKWVVPAFTFPSPVVGGMFDVDVVDIDPHTYTLPCSRKLLKKYDGVIITNLFGSYVDLEEWESTCCPSKALIFDNASSPLSTYAGGSICPFGDSSFGSFHHTKYLGFGEGGFAVVAQEDYDKITAISNFGFHGTRQYKEHSSNFKMSDVSAAFILSHVLDFDIDRYKDIQNEFIDGVNSMRGVRPFNYKPGTIYNGFPVLFDKPVKTGFFEENGIKVHKYYEPLDSLPNSMALFDRIVNFPMYPLMTLEQVDYILSFIWESVT